MILTFIIISFYLENSFNLLINNNITPMFFLVTLILLYPYFNSNKMKYIIVLFIAGIIYDITFTNLLYINALLFPLIGLLTTIFNKNFNNNYFNNLIFNAISLTIYQLIFYLFFIIISYNEFNEILFLKSILSSCLVNLIYFTICYIVLNKVANKFSIKRME